MTGAGPCCALVGAVPAPNNFLNRFVAPLGKGEAFPPLLVVAATAAAAVDSFPPSPNFENHALFSSMPAAPERMIVSIDVGGYLSSFPSVFID